MLVKNIYRHSTTKMNLRTAFAIVLLIALVAGAVIGVVGFCKGEELITCYALCKPGSQVNVRMTPSIKGKCIGYLDSGDNFQTDGESENGWIRCYGIGETSGWVYVGFVSTEPPEKIGERYVCVSNAKVICRRWQGGPQVTVNGKKQYLKNGQNVQVFCIADGWAVTNRGFVRAEYLEVDPE